MRVLVVEDHMRLASALAEGLRREGMAVDVALDGADALAHVTVNGYDVVVLDRDLPTVHGDQVCKALVASGAPTRVLMLTAASTIRDRVEGLEFGADDYLPQPCEVPELVARVRALARRAVAALPPTLARGDVALDPSRRVAFRGDRRLSLTPKEFALLECLLQADGRVVSGEELLSRVWDEEATRSPPLSRPRSVGCGPSSAIPRVIETVREAGYRI
jgi:DNA-binding response OmpR family regulator